MIVADWSQNFCVKWHLFTILDLDIKIDNFW